MYAAVQQHLMVAMPLPLLLGASAAIEVISPDDLVLFAKSAGVVLAAQLPTWQEVVGLVAFTIGASLFRLINGNGHTMRKIITHQNISGVGQIAVSKSFERR